MRVNLDKAWVMLLVGEESESKTLATVKAARLTDAGGSLVATAQFTYPGVDLHCVDRLGWSSAASGGWGRAAVSPCAGL